MEEKKDGISQIKKTAKIEKPAEKKTTSPKTTKTAVNSRMAKLQSLVTKDSNNMAEIPLDQSLKISQDYSDSTLMLDKVEAVNLNDENEFTQEGNTVVIEHNPYRKSTSRTIDNTMLSQDRMRGKKRAKSVDFSKAERFYPDAERGLAIHQVEQRKEEGYVNYTKKSTAKSYKRIFFSNICTLINFISLVVAIGLMFSGAEFSQFVFMFIIGINTTIGIIQEIRSKRTVEKLSIVTAPTAVVIRNGEQVVIPIGEVVLDDILFLEVGKQICADAIVIKGICEVNEAMLTGESDNVKKSDGMQLFSGSFVSSGNCYARVDKVGSANYVETLTSHAKKYKKPKSELFTSIQTVIKVIVPLAIIITGLTMINYYNSAPADNKDWADNIQRAAAITIGMLPTGMFLLISTALVVSVMRLSKRKTLVQDLYCIEMLARVNVLCLDKTGTITDGTMQVNDVVEVGKKPNEDYTLNDIIGSILTATEDNNQTARALAEKFGYSKKLKPVVTMPFSSQRKLAATQFENAGTYIYGAPEFVLKDIKVGLENHINKYASQGYRVLVLAHSNGGIVKDKLPLSVKPIALIVIEDHIREDAIETIKWFRENEVAVKVISGDNPITVSEVARRVGVENAELYISLDGLSNQEVIEAASKYTVFGRVTPEQKMILVKSMKRKGNTVAMTGDGVNDILAMKESDCAISIASGAEATRNVAHLVLLDSNFSSMPQVVMEGRRVVNNVQQSSSLFLMKTFMTVILSISVLIMSTFMTISYPFKTSSLLLLEFCIIAISSFSLALQKNDSLIKGKFLTNVIGRSLPGGITLALSTLFIYFYYTFLLAPTTEATAIYETMLVINVTCVGYMVLAKICEPINAFRAVLLVVVALSIILGMFMIPSAIGLTAILSQTEVYFTVCVILISYFLVSILMKILKAVKVIT